MLKALSFRPRQDPPVHHKKDDGDDHHRAWRRRRSTCEQNIGSGNAGNSDGNRSGNGGAGVRRRGGPSARLSVWEKPDPTRSASSGSGGGLGCQDDLDDLLTGRMSGRPNQQRRRSSVSMSGDLHDRVDRTGDRGACDMDHPFDDLHGNDMESVSGASFAVRAASLAFGTASAAAEAALDAERAAGPPRAKTEAQKVQEQQAQAKRDAAKGGEGGGGGGGVVYSGGRTYDDWDSEHGRALGRSHKHHSKILATRETERGVGGSSSDPSESDAERAVAAAGMAMSPAVPRGGGRRKSGEGRHRFLSILRHEDEREGGSRHDSLTNAMRTALDSDTSDSGQYDGEGEAGGKGASFARQRRRSSGRGRRMGTLRRACAALAAAAALAIGIVAVLLPDDAPPAVVEAKAKAKRAADDVGLALRVVVSGREAAGLPVDHRDHRAKGGGSHRHREVEVEVEDAEVSGGASDAAASAADDVAIDDGRGSVHMRALERLHRPINQMFAVSDGDNAAAAAGNPNVLPPLEGYNTAIGPNDSGIFIPTFTSRNYADIWSPVTRMDLPMYWHIPKSGGTTIQDILGHCLNKVQASDLASHDKTLSERFRSSLDVFSNQDGLRYVNVDTTTIEGIERAKRLGLASSGVADFVITHRFHDVSSVFNYEHRGRAFALFRHPAKRAVSMFYYLQTATWEPTYDESLSSMTLLEYARSSRAEENWVVRSLTNEFEEPVGVQHLEVAKEILRRKVLVGILEFFDQSLVRFEQFFGWWPEAANDVEVLRCQRDRISGGDNRNDHPNIGPGTAEFKALSDKNWADVELYHYAKSLFVEQASLV